MVQRHEGILSRHLQGHERKRAEVDARAVRAQADDFRIGRNDPDQPFGDQHDQRPYDAVHHQRARERKADGPGHALRLARAEVVAHHGRSAVGYARGGQLRHLAQGIDHRHRTHVQRAHRAAEALERHIHDRLRQAVGAFEGKARRAQLQYGAHGGSMNAQAANRQNRLFAAQEHRDPQRADRLRNDRRQRRAANTHVHRIDHDGIEDRIQHRADDHREHTRTGKALRIDKRIHAQADQHRNGTEHIDAEIFHRVGKRFCIAAQHLQQRGRERIHHDRQHAAHDDQHRKRGFFNQPRAFHIALAARNARKRSAARAAQIGERRYDGNQRKRHAHARQRQRAHLRHMADKHAIHQIV